MARFYIEGAQIDTEIFDPNGAYTYCNLCGAIYQPSTNIEPISTELRKRWAIKHSAKHSEKEHRAYKLSNKFLTPEAQIKLAAFGIVEINNDQETRQALLESKPKLDEIQQPSRKELKQWDITK